MVKWKRNSMRKMGFGWESSTKQIMIAPGMFWKGYTVLIWQSHPVFKDISTRNFKTLRQAQSYATKYMKK